MRRKNGRETTTALTFDDVALAAAGAVEDAARVGRRRRRQVHGVADVERSSSSSSAAAATSSASSSAAAVGRTSLMRTRTNQNGHVSQIRHLLLEEDSWRLLERRVVLGLATLSTTSRQLSSGS